MLKCLVINLDHQVDRMNFMRTQLNNLGLEFHRLPGIKPEEANLLRNEAYWGTWERPLKKTERACLLSHVTAWKKVSDEDFPWLILEDDAMLSKHTPQILTSLQKIRQFDHLTVEVRNRQKLVSKDPSLTLINHKVFRLYQDRSGAAAYILWPTGARKLLKNVYNQAGLADAIICHSYHLNSYQIEPACAVQLDSVEKYGLKAPLKTRSSILNSIETTASHQTKSQLYVRFKSQVRMGLRMLSKPQACRRNITLVPDDFNFI